MCCVVVPLNSRDWASRRRCSVTLLKGEDPRRGPGRFAQGRRGGYLAAHAASLCRKAGPCRSGPGNAAAGRPVGSEILVIAERGSNAYSRSGTPPPVRGALLRHPRECVRPRGARSRPSNYCQRATPEAPLRATSPALLQSKPNGKSSIGLAHLQRPREPRVTSHPPLALQRGELVADGRRAA